MVDRLNKYSLNEKINAYMDKCYILADFTYYFKIIFTTGRPKKWDSDVELYTKIHAPPSIVRNCCWEAAVQVGTTFPRTPRTHVINFYQSVWGMLCVSLSAPAFKK